MINLENNSNASAVINSSADSGWHNSKAYSYNEVSSGDMP